MPRYRYTPPSLPPVPLSRTSAYIMSVVRFQTFPSLAVCFEKRDFSPVTIYVTWLRCRKLQIKRKQCAAIRGVRMYTSQRARRENCRVNCILFAKYLATAAALKFILRHSRINIRLILSIAMIQISNVVRFLSSCKTNFAKARCTSKNLVAQIFSCEKVDRHERIKFP